LVWATTSAVRASAPRVESCSNALDDRAQRLIAPTPTATQMKKSRRRQEGGARGPPFEGRTSYGRCLLTAWRSVTRVTRRRAARCDRPSCELQVVGHQDDGRLARDSR
jgi:hypothetical protein